MDMKADSLVPALIVVSEKAANIARLCRQDENLLAFLIQEKKDSEKNPRFVTDFKTLADVLVQELVKHDLCSKFPSLEGHIHGEETNEFSGEGEGSLVVEVKESEEEMSELLNQVLNDKAASDILARAVLSDVEVELSAFIDDLDNLPKLPDGIGVWIDPIDATSEYIRGVESQTDSGLVRSGLPCVTILIGVFNLESGEPLMGVINQPFHTQQQEFGWKGRQIFGISNKGANFSYPKFPLLGKNTIAVSSSEKESIKSALSEAGYEILEIAGAGYKLLNIITGNVLAYVLSKPTSFLWDICAPHSILNSIGGGIIELSSLTPIKYKAGSGLDLCCNSGGIIAYRSEDVKDNLIKILNLSS